MSDNRVSILLQLRDEASRGIRSAGEQLRATGSIGRTAFAAMDSVVQNLTGSLQVLGEAKGLAEKLLLPGVRAASDLETLRLQFAAALDPRPAKEMTAALQEIERASARIAGPTIFSPAEVGQGALAFLQAGVSERDMMPATSAAALLATAEGGKLSMEQASEAMISTGAIFRISGEEYVSAADLLKRASSASTASVADLAAAVGGAPGVGQAGLSLRDTLAILGAASTTGLKGAPAGTALDAFVGAAAAKNDKLGLGLFDREGRLLDLLAMSDALNKKFGSLNPQQRTAALGETFGDTAGPMALTLMDREKLQAALAGMEKSRSLTETVDIMAGGTGAKWQALTGTAEGTLGSLYTPLLEPLSAGLDKANGALGALATTADENPAIKDLVSYGSLAAVASVASLALGGQRGATLLTALKSGQVSGLLGAAGGTAAGVAAGQALQAATGTQPVFVVNWPAGGIGGIGSVAGGAPGAVGSGLGLASLLRGGLAVGGNLLAAASGYELGSGLRHQFIDGTKLETALDGALGLFAASPVGKALLPEDVSAGGAIAFSGMMQQLADALKLDIRVTWDVQNYMPSIEIMDGTGAVTRDFHRGAGAG